MRQAFSGYYRPTPDEFDSLWENACVVLDANALLNFYGYSPKTRRLFIGLLARFNDRVWIPYQYALEYQRNRQRVIVDQVNNYTTARKKLETLIAQEFKSNKKHPYISKSSLRSIEKLCADLRLGESKHRKMLSNDEYHEQISSIFKDKVGSAYPEDALTDIYTKGVERYAKSVPPGFADKQKPEPDRYGDLVGWMEILDNGKSRGVDTIFVTDDAKEDWWSINKSENAVIGPRPELVDEYRNMTGKLFHMYSAENFISNAAKRFSVRLNSDTIDELRAKNMDQSPPPKAQSSQIFIENNAISDSVSSSSDKPAI